MEASKHYTDSLRPRRRWLQYSLRTLLLVVFVASVGMIPLGVKVQKARVQKRSVTEIRRLGGYVFYAGESHSGKPDPPARARVTTWLHDFLGEDFFITVETAGFPKEAPEADLRHVRGLTQLKTLVLHRAKVADADLENLEGLSELESLTLSGTKVTDAGLKHIEGLAKLEKVDVGDTGVTDAGLKCFERLTNLKELDLSNAEVNGAGLTYLQGLTGLREVVALRHAGDGYGTKLYRRTDATPNVEPVWHARHRCRVEVSRAIDDTRDLGSVRH